MSDPVGFFNKLIHAYHGSPYAFSKFDPTKIGSGEGAQAYGYGHYFTDKEEIARRYRDQLSVKDDRLFLDGKHIPIRKSGGNSDDRAFDRMLQNARQNYFDNATPNIHPDDASDVLRNAFVGHPEGRLFADRLKGQTISYQPGGGHMYDVNLGVNPKDLLNWDAPLSTQSKGVREILGDFGYKADPEGVLRHDDALLAALTNPDPSLPLPAMPPDPMGYSIYGGRRIAPSGRNADVSDALRERGIPGIKYLDGFSRGAGEGTSNYVMFPGTEDLININRRYADGGPVDTPTEGEGGIYGAPDSMFNTPESLAAALYPQHDTAYGGGGPVEMQVGGADKIKDAVGFLRRSIMPHAREKSMVPPNRDIESRYWDHKKPSDLDTITADYGVNHLPVDVPTMKIEDIKGGRVFAIPHDRSATDLLLGGYNGNTFANPVTSPGGPLYAFGRNPEAVTASGEKVIKNLHESALRAADEGKTPYLAPWLMGPHGVDFSTHMNEAVVQSLPFLKVPTEKKKEVDALLSGVFKDFPGIDHKDLAQYLNSITGTTRRDLPKLLDTGAMVNAGLDVGGLRAALTEPSLLHAPYGSSGAAISRIDPSMSPTMFGYPHHPSYPWQLRGTPVGGLDPLVPSQILYPDIYRTLPPDTQLGPKGKPVNNRRAFEMKSMLGDVYQDVNDEVINGVNEYQEYMRKIRGRKEGGTVEDQYHPIWQQGFAGGGQPDRPRLDGFDAMARNRPDKYDPVSASLYPWLMDKEDFQPDYGFRKIDGPLDLTHNMDNSLLFQSREPFEGRGFTLTPEEKRAKWLEQRGLEAKPESDINPYDIIKAYAHSLGQRHKEWKPSYSGESLPWQMLQSVGDLGRVASKSVTGDFGDTLSASMRPWDGSYEDRLMQENDLTRQSERDIHPLLKDITSIPALISQRLWAAPAIGDAASNLATPANSVGEWANNQIRPIVGALRNMPDAINRARDMFSGVQPEGRMEPSYYDHGGSVEDQYHPIWSQNFKDGGGVHDILGTLGGLAGNLIPIPVLGPMLGKFAGHTLGNLIEGGSDEIGDDAARDFSFGMADPDAQGWAFGGPIGPTLPKDDFTSGGEEPGMPFFGVGVPEFDVDPLRTNPQVARDAAERRRLLGQVQADSQRGLAEQMKASSSGGGGGGMGGMLSALAPFASMIPGVGPMVGMGMSMAGKMMAADGGPVSHYADGGSIPAPNGEQPWMYGGGALMARGGYLRGHGGMNG